MATFADYVNSFPGGLNVDPSFATVSPDWATAAGFTAPPASYVTDSGGGTDSIVTNAGQQITQTTLEQVADIVFKLANRRIDEIEARRRLSELKLVSESIDQFVKQGLEQQRALIGAPPPVITPQIPPTGPAAPATRDDIYKRVRAGTLDKATAIRMLGEIGYTSPAAEILLGSKKSPANILTLTPEQRAEEALLELQGDIPRAFEQLFDVSRLTPGNRLTSQSFNFLGAPARAGFTLAPFLRPDLNIKDFQSFQLEDFLQGGIPGVQDITRAFQSAARTPAGLKTPQSYLAEVLREPSANPSAFNLAFSPHLARTGGFWRGILDRALSREFNRFQQLNPGLSFLDELGMGRLPQFGGGFGGF